MGGLLSGARGPPLNWSLKELNGTCGFSAKVVVRRPVAGSAATLPTSRAETPWRGDSASTKMRYSWPEVGSRLSCLPRKTSPVSEPGGSGGVSIATVPSLEAAGQETGFLVPLPSWASAQERRPCAAAGLRPMPSGRVVRAVRTLELAIGCNGSNGTVASTVAPAGESVRSVPGLTPIPGLNGTSWQPVGLVPGGRAASSRLEPLGKAGSGISTESARRYVE